MIPNEGKAPRTTQALVLLLLCFTQNTYGQSAAVIFNVVDSFGSRLPYVVEKFVSSRGNGDLSSHFDGCRGTAITYGVSIYRVEPLHSLCLASGSNG